MVKYQKKKAKRGGATSDIDVECESCHKRDTSPPEAQNYTKSIYSQNFWSSVFHLSLDKERKVQAYILPNVLIDTFKAFKRSHIRITYRGAITAGVPECFPHTATELATVYTNMIVEDFEKLQNKFVLCNEKRKWRSDLSGSEKKEDVIQFIEGINNILSCVIQELVSLEPLSNDPGAVGPVLSHIIYVEHMLVIYKVKKLYK
ncbi:hypothetical protein K501DRAFT_272804 [Backusella circina FSU 941]|nr:hypothetical protein K501DRAFT_272804 [Backusella circina FSU 941]